MTRHTFYLKLVYNFYLLVLSTEEGLRASQLMC